LPPRIGSSSRTSLARRTVDALISELGLWGDAKAKASGENGANRAKQICTTSFLAVPESDSGAGTYLIYLRREADYDRFLQRITTEIDRTFAPGRANVEKLTIAFGACRAATTTWMGSSGRNCGLRA
jgi:hypothetical protein